MTEPTPLLTMTITYAAREDGHPVIGVNWDGIELLTAFGMIEFARLDLIGSALGYPDDDDG